MNITQPKPTPAAELVVTCRKQKEAVDKRMREALDEQIIEMENHRERLQSRIDDVRDRLAKAKKEREALG